MITDAEMQAIMVQIIGMLLKKQATPLESINICLAVMTNILANVEDPTELLNDIQVAIGQLKERLPFLMEELVAADVDSIIECADEEKKKH
jgi:hypothetical protein